VKVAVGKRGIHLIERVLGAIWSENNIRGGSKLPWPTSGDGLGKE
jgi:hypothetical protein